MSALRCARPSFVRMPPTESSQRSHRPGHVLVLQCPEFVPRHSIPCSVAPREFELGHARPIHRGDAQPLHHEVEVLRYADALLVAPSQALLTIRVAGVRRGSVGFEDSELHVIGELSLEEEVRDQ